MKCPKCGGNSLYSVCKRDEHEAFTCDKCFEVFTSWQQSRIEDLEDQLAATKKELDALQIEFEHQCGLSVEFQRELAATKLRWQTGIIPKTAYYWLWKKDGLSTPYIYHVNEGELISTACKPAMWWAGPLEPPEEYEYAIDGIYLKTSW